MIRRLTEMDTTRHRVAGRRPRPRVNPTRQKVNGFRQRRHRARGIPTRLVIDEREIFRMRPMPRGIDEVPAFRTWVDAMRWRFRGRPEISVHFEEHRFRYVARARQG